MFSIAQFTFLITIGFCPPAALVGGIVVALLTWSLVVGLVAGIVGLAVGLVAGDWIAGFCLRRWPGETDDPDLIDDETWERAERRDAARRRPWTEKELDARQKVDRAMIELEVRALDEQRDLTVPEKWEMECLRAKVREIDRAHDGATWWRDAIETVFAWVLAFGGPITTLAVALLVGWVLGG